MYGKHIQCTKYRARDGEIVKNKPSSSLWRSWKQHQFRLCWGQDKNREWLVMLGNRSSLEWDRMKDEDSDKERQRTRERDPRKERETQMFWNTETPKVLLPFVHYSLIDRERRKSPEMTLKRQAVTRKHRTLLAMGVHVSILLCNRKPLKGFFAGCSIYFKSEPMFSSL